MNSSDDQKVSQEDITLAQSLNSGIQSALIVDDSYLILDMFSQALQVIKPDIEVLTATATDEAQKQFENHREALGLVLMDFRLSDRASGVWLIESFLEAEPDLIILANSAMREYDERMVAAGAVAAIQKKIPAFVEWWIEYFSK